MKNNDIVKLAKKCVYNVEKKHTANIDNTRNYTTNAYIFSKSILKPGKDVGVKKIPVNPKPQHSSVNGGIGIKNFTTLCQLYVNSCDKNKKAPSYLMFNKKKIGVDTWAYATARVVTYYAEKKKLPNKVMITSKIFDDEIKRIEEEKKKKAEAEKRAREEAERKAKEEEERKAKENAKRKYDHADDYGCDEMGQNTSYYCGCHSLQEVFRNLTNIVVSQDTIADVCGTTYDGTDHEGLNTCVEWFNRKFDQNLQVSWKNFSDLGWDGIRDIVYSNNQDCVIHNLYRDKYGHYEVVNWVSDAWVGVQNSLGDGCSYGCYCGYKEDRTQSEFRSYISGISQKSVMVITNA